MKNVVFVKKILEWKFDFSFLIFYFSFLKIFLFLVFFHKNQEFFGSFCENSSILDIN